MIQFPDNSSPFWPILRMLAVAVVLAVILHANYASGFVPEKDIPTIIGTLLTAGGLEGLQRFIGGKKE